MFNSSLNKVKETLIKVLKEKEEDVIRLRFDLYHCVKRYEEMKPELITLEQKKIKLREELNLLNQMGGKTTKTKERILVVQGQMGENAQEISKIAETYKDVEKARRIIPLVENMIEEIKRCIENPNIIYDKNLFEEQKKGSES